MRISRELRTLRLTQSMRDNYGNIRNDLEKGMILEMLQEAEKLELYESCAELQSLLTIIERDEKINQILD
jgi:hypothetical protein